MPKKKRIKPAALRTLEELKKTGTIIHAIIYCRVSSEKQAREGSGLDTQEQRCREYADRNGYVINPNWIFKDTASGGGAYTTRSGQVTLLEVIDKNPAKNFVVVVDDISRVARDVQAHFQLRLLLRQRGVVIASPNFNFDETVEGELVEGMMAMVSQYTRKGNARQVIQKQKARLEGGYWAFPAPKGYRMVHDPIHGNICVLRDPEAQWLKEAMEGFANATFPRLIDACRFLVEKGFWKTQSPDRYIDKFKEICSYS